LIEKARTDHAGEIEGLTQGGVEDVLDLVPLRVEPLRLGLCDVTGCGMGNGVPISKDTIRASGGPRN